MVIELQTNFVSRLFSSLSTNSKMNAFCIRDTFYTYHQLSERVCIIRNALATIDEQYIGLVSNDDLNTYASILAIWMEGKCYVPLHPMQPLVRCLDIVEQVGIHTILDSSETTRYTHQNTIATARLKGTTGSLLSKPAAYDVNHDAYVLFTSGSTGRPKGVPITFGCLEAFIEAFVGLGIHLTTEDHCLQMFDLTFDLSLGSYLPPLLAGACVYTAGLGGLKWQEAFRLLDEYQLTMTLMVPSVVHYLRPYMDEIDAPQLRYSLFCGEALMIEDAKAWLDAVPQARVLNVYGPTENTIYCTAYEIQNDICGHNGIVSIGKDMLHTRSMIVNENLQPIDSGQEGELCLSGQQLTKGYWQNEERNKAAFFMYGNERWYLTGDLCRYADDGNIIYLGRKDSQVKIQGYRIELSEIEEVARRFYNHEIAAVAVAVGEAPNKKLVLAVEKEDDGNENQLLEFLKKFLPSYMIPAKVVYLPQFPQNANNKTDRKRIGEIVE